MTPRRLLSLAAAAIFLAVFAGSVAAQEQAGKASESEAEKPKAKKKPAAKAKKKARESRYKSRELTENTENSYRFDARGNPLGGKRKAAEKAKKKSAAPPEEMPEEKPGACTADEPCPEKGSDADAL
ncbi:MAG: hypothetical protein A2506_08775 [Elusimicrobia bacterium RIFOXYD12_FULL_66_9]|nr:MAG: hypothetical protein A2506_08775 [Elusimicrobia bacterium RIFOXYD12_FULL_66_9]